jgi:hypothetical protein
MIAGLDLLRCEHGDHVDARSARCTPQKAGSNYPNPDSPPDSARHRHQAPRTPLPQRSLSAPPPQARTGSCLRIHTRKPVRNDNAAPARRLPVEVRRVVSSHVRPRESRAGGAQQIGDLDVSCDHHVFDANSDSALAVGHFCTANRGQSNLNHALTAAIRPTPPALPTMRSAQSDARVLTAPK